MHLKSCNFCFLTDVFLLLQDMVRLVRGGHGNNMVRLLRGGPGNMVRLVRGGSGNNMVRLVRRGNNMVRLMKKKWDREGGAFEADDVKRDSALSQRYMNLRQL